MATRQPVTCRILAAVVLGVGACSVAGCETPSANSASYTTTTLYPCEVDAVFLDPDEKIAAVEPGCTVDLEIATLGPGGLFDVIVRDDAGGASANPEYDPVSVSDGERFVVEHQIGDERLSTVSVSVDLRPSQHHGSCSDDSHGASTDKQFPTRLERDCVVTFRATDEVDLGGIWFDADYTASNAEFPGCGAAVACVSPLDDREDDPFGGSLPYDVDDNRRVMLRVVNGQGFSAPVDLARCDVRLPPGADAPLPEDFIASVVKAYSPPPLAEPLEPLPAIDIEVDCDLGPTTTTTLPYVPAQCGQPCSAAATQPSARDALYVLQAAVGAGTCKTCICDVNRSGSVDATDGLAVLTRAVGLDASMRCVICAEPVSPGCAAAAFRYDVARETFGKRR